MDPFILLKNDHEKINELFAKLDRTSEKAIKTREGLFADLQFALDTHAKVEEKNLYDRLRKNNKMEDLIGHSYDEHAEIKDLLKELDSIAKDTENWLDILDELKDLVTHHVEEEEREMFPKAERMLSKSELDDIGDKINEEESKAYNGIGKKIHDFMKK